MPIRPGMFSHQKALDTARANRAYADVRIAGPAASSLTWVCLVDTGSDFTILPMAAAMAAGITPSGSAVTFQTAGGARYSLPSHAPVPLIIEGYLVPNARVVFSAGQGFSPILGRGELLAAFDVGFSRTDWFWD